MQTTLFLLVAFFMGIVMSIYLPMNSSVSRHLGSPVAASVVFFIVALATTGMVFIYFGNRPNFNGDSGQSSGYSGIPQRSGNTQEAYRCNAGHHRSCLINRLVGVYSRRENQIDGDQPLKGELNNEHHRTIAGIQRQRHLDYCA